MEVKEAAANRERSSPHAPPPNHPTHPRQAHPRPGAAIARGLSRRLSFLLDVPLEGPARHGLSPPRGWQGKHFSHYPVAVNWGSAKDSEPTPLWWWEGSGVGSGGCLIIEGLPWGASDIGNPHD